MNIKKAVITAAARGERLYPVADTVQKAMLPIIDIDGINKPIIQVIAEEAIASGIEEICIVCAPGDEEKYIESFQFLRSTLLKAYKNSDWAQIQAENIRNLLDRLSFTVQNEQLGYGHAVYQAKQFVNNEPFILLLGDYLYVSAHKEKRCAQQLIELAVREDCSVSAVNPTIEHLINKYGTLTGRSILTYNDVYQIERIIEKPSVSQAELELQTPGLRAGYYLCFFGMHVFKPSLFDLLGSAIDDRKNDIVLLTPVLEKLAQTDKYLALEIKGNRFDTTKRLGLMEAQIALCLGGTLREEVLSSILQILAESGKKNVLGI
jgi:UTP--glucose-1-phosphate uridylyltransferase